MPVVSVDVGDVRERINGIAGCVLCEERSAPAIAKGLGQVLARGSRIQGRKAVQDLDEDLVAQSVFEVYQSVIER